MLKNIEYSLINSQIKLTILIISNNYKKVLINSLI